MALRVALLRTSGAAIRARQTTLLAPARSAQGWGRADWRQGMSARWMATGTGSGGGGEDDREDRSTGRRRRRGQQRQEAEEEPEPPVGGGGFFAQLKQQLKREVENNEELRKGWKEVQERMNLGSRGGKGEEQGQPSDGQSKAGSGSDGQAGADGSAQSQGPSGLSRLKGLGEAVRGQLHRAREAVGASGVTDAVKATSEQVRSKVSQGKESLRSKVDEAKQEAARIAEESELVRESKRTVDEAKQSLESTTGAVSFLQRVRARLHQANVKEQIRDAVEEVFMSERERKQRVAERQGEVEEQQRRQRAWREYSDPGTGRAYYHNSLTEETTWVMPEEYRRMVEEGGPPPEEAAQAGAAGAAGEAAGEEDEPTGSALVETKGGQSAWERLGEKLRRTPIIQEILGLGAKAGETVVGSKVGELGRQARDKLGDKAEDIREAWETSQNPWVYRLSAAMDTVFAESEMATCIRETQRLDPAFTVHEFKEDMEHNTIPKVLGAFLRGDMAALQPMCSESALAMVKANMAVRQAEGLVMDPNILDVRGVELSAAKMLERDSPIYVFQCQAHQINCIRDQRGNVVEGREDEIRAVFYAFAMQRVYDDKAKQLKWELVEFGVLGSLETW